MKASLLLSLSSSVILGLAAVAAGCASASDPPLGGPYGGTAGAVGGGTASSTSATDPAADPGTSTTPAQDGGAATGTSGTSGTSGTTDSGADADAANPPVDSGPDGARPTVTCVVQVLYSGAANQTCSAAAEALTPGGGFAVGGYQKDRFWRNGGCGANERYYIGSASVFVQGGNTFMRYTETRRAVAGDPGTTVNGTWWLQSDGAGNLTRTEVCNAALLGTKETGTYQQTALTPTRLLVNIGGAFEDSWVHLP